MLDSIVASLLADLNIQILLQTVTEIDRYKQNSTKYKKSQNNDENRNKNVRH